MERIARFRPASHSQSSYIATNAWTAVDTVDRVGFVSGDFNQATSNGIAQTASIPNRGSFLRGSSRTGQKLPSFVVPFIEPYMPYYDPIRESPEFAELMAEIEAGSL